MPYQSCGQSLALAGNHLVKKVMSAGAAVPIYDCGTEFAGRETAQLGNDFRSPHAQFGAFCRWTATLLEQVFAKIN